MKNLLLVFTFVVSVSVAKASEINFEVLDTSGKPLDNAVVIIDASTAGNALESTNKRMSMRQVNKQFVPHVLAVSVGTEIDFPNADKVKHHVYSFSEAKTFEIKLYSNFEGTPLTFDKAGIVELGCNIHDWMLGYIFVTDADYFFTTDSSGKYSLDLPADEYTISIWHARAEKADIKKLTKVNISGAQTVKLSLTQPLLPAIDFSSGFDDY